MGKDLEKMVSCGVYGVSGMHTTVVESAVVDECSVCLTCDSAK